MTDEFDPDFDDAASAAPETPEERLPEWYREIFPAGPRDGFYEKLGPHVLIHVDRGKSHLIVTFDNLSDAGYPGYDIRPWAEKFVRDNGWSHLGICAQGPTWYRDKRLIARMEKLRDDGFFAQFDRIVMAGASMGGFAAMIFADLAPGCDVLALSPQSTLNGDAVPWEKRFAKGRRQDWTLPRSDASDHIAQAGRIWALYDPFLTNDARQIDRMPQDNLVRLKGFGFGHKSAVVLRRMELLKEVMMRAVQGDLTQSWFQQATRRRKDVYLYRKEMETHLTQRGKDGLLPGFTAAFRRRARRNAALAAAQEAESGAAASEPEPARTIASSAIPDRVSAAPAVPQPPRRPLTLGNVWNLTDDGQVLRYLSDQYRHQVMGFEERDGVTLAQTPDLARAMLAFGAAAAVPRPLPERFDYHIRDENLSQDSAPLGAEAQGVAALSLIRAACEASPMIFALSAPQAGITAAEAGGDLLAGLCERIATARDAAQDLGKSFFIDRISVDLLAGGAADLNADAAQSHYSATITDLRRRTAETAGQRSLPWVVLSQKPGGRDDGRSAIALAEGRLDIREPGLGAVVASPSYMMRLMADTEATLHPEDRMILDELEALAIDAVLNGRPWHCPALRQVFRHGTDLVAEFATMSPLEIDPEAAPAAHGFTLEGCTNGARLTGLRLAPATPGAQRVMLSFDRAPEGPDLALAYAWGHAPRADQGERPANHGALRESWSQDSLLVPGRRLHRYALSGLAPVTQSALPAEEG